MMKKFKMLLQFMIVGLLISSNSYATDHLTLNNPGNKVYLLVTGGSENRITSCDIDSNGDFSDCSTFPDLTYELTSMAINPSETTAYFGLAGTGNYSFVSGCHLKEQTCFELPNPQIGSIPGAVALNHDGTAAYISNFGLELDKPAMTRCTIASDGTFSGCVALQGVKYLTLYNASLKFNSTGKFLYDARWNPDQTPVSIITKYAVMPDGSLKRLNEFPIATRIFDFVFNPSGKLAYILRKPTTGSAPSVLEKCSVNALGDLILPCSSAAKFNYIASVAFSPTKPIAYIMPGGYYDVYKCKVDNDGNIVGDENLSECTREKFSPF